MTDKPTELPNETLDLLSDCYDEILRLSRQLRDAEVEYDRNRIGDLLARLKATGAIDQYQGYE